MMSSEFLVFFLLWFAGNSAAHTKPGCQPKCGKINIPYPFGIGRNCSIGAWANVNCNNTFHPPKPFILRDLEVIEFSPTEVRIKNFVATTCYNRTGAAIKKIQSWINLDGTPYTFSSTENRLMVVGCDTFAQASLDGGTYSLLCLCNRVEDVIQGFCPVLGCCQTSIAKGLKNFSSLTSSLNNYTRIWTFDSCGSSFLAEQKAYNFKVSDFSDVASLRDVPIVLNFGVENRTCESATQDKATYACKDNSYCLDSVDGNGYLCNCRKGYQGNPYLDQGCQDVNECAYGGCEGICTNTPGGYNCTCPDDSYGDGTKDGSGCTKKDKKVPILQLTLGLGFGLLLLLVGGYWLYVGIKKRKLFKLKEKFFMQNGGLLLKRQISSHEGSAESTKIFTAEELKLATNNYDHRRIIGQGGSGTVYKGILPDLRITAIKKSKIVDGSQVGQFINEVVILTQINHRNVVKLIGCCLETEVPLLVYEFVANGTLFSHLHAKRGAMSSISWDDRLRIAAETAGALSYLHSAASIPIIHRDVKSANILLDNNYTAKVADFGASRLNPFDETQISTLVQGTMGYLDPEYFHTSQLTDKSDVYSFGVVLAELLTGEKPLCFERSENQRNLATYFIAAMKENSLFQLLEAGVVNEGKIDHVHEVARLAKRCLNLKGSKRPTMKEVAAELEGLRGFRKRSSTQENSENNMGSSNEEVDLYPIPSGSYKNDGASVPNNSEEEMGWSILNFPR